jgi:hypothetical protein
MTNNKWQRVIAFVCAAGLLMTSCTSLHRVSVPGSETNSTVPSVQVGDSVVVTTRSGEQKKFKVTAVEPDALAGKNVRVAYGDMASLSVRERSVGKTTLLVALVTLGVYMIVGADALEDGVEETIHQIPGN